MNKRFVCNYIYIYWSSLNKIKSKLQSKQIQVDTGKPKEPKATTELENRILNQESSTTIHSIFVHVPLFTVIDQETQFCFIERLLDSIHEDVTSPKKKKNRNKKKQTESNCK